MPAARRKPHSGQMPKGRKQVQKVRQTMPPTTQEPRTRSHTPLPDLRAEKENPVCGAPANAPGDPVPKADCCRHSPWKRANPASPSRPTHSRTADPCLRIQPFQTANPNSGSAALANRNFLGRCSWSKKEKMGGHATGRPLPEGKITEHKGKSRASPKKVSPRLATFNQAFEAVPHRNLRNRRQPVHKKNAI